MPVTRLDPIVPAPPLVSVNAAAYFRCVVKHLQVVQTIRDWEKDVKRIPNGVLVDPRTCSCGRTTASRRSRPRVDPPEIGLSDAPAVCMEVDTWTMHQLRLARL